MSEVIDVIVQSLRDVLKRQPSEGLLWDNYGKLCLLIDEIVNEVRQDAALLVNLDLICIPSNLKKTLVLSRGLYERLFPCSMLRPTIHAFYHVTEVCGTSSYTLAQTELLVCKTFYPKLHLKPEYFEHAPDLMW